MGERIAEWSDRQPDKHVYVFLDKGRETRRLTYADLHHSACRVATRILSRVPEQSRVLVLCPDPSAFAIAFMGCLYANVTAVPTFPPDPHRLQRSLARLISVGDDARPSIVLATEQVLAVREQLEVELGHLDDLDWIAVDRDEDAGGAVPPLAAPRLPKPHHVALLQYTSGSTGAPKGVIVTHDNLVENERAIEAAFDHQPTSVVVGWLPLFHDMGLIGNLLQPAFMGGTCILMSPIDFLQRPLRWLEAISSYRATTSGAPNFAYALCARRADPAHAERLDLSSWTLAFNGAEPIHVDTMRRFADVFGPCGFRLRSFYPCYGLAESTLMVTGGERASMPTIRGFDAEALGRGEAVPQERGSRDLVGCGRPVRGQEVRIVDPDDCRELEEGRIGEIWLRGSCVADGYWGRPEETEETFRSNLAGRPADETYLRTGDLGFLCDGELFVTGRIKDLIIVRGTNHYPHDLERVVCEAHPGCQAGGAAAFSTTVSDGREGVVVVQELRQEIELREAEELMKCARKLLVQGFGIQAAEIVLVPKGAVPKTSSGKIQRRRCRELLNAGELPVVHRWAGGGANESCR